MEKYFSKQPRLTFLTIKSPKKNHQSISWCSDRLRKISDNFFVTREQNKLDTNYHFHALVSVRDEIKKGWYLKGVHVHSSSLSAEQKFDLPPLTAQERGLSDALDLETLKIAHPDDWEELDIERQLLALLDAIPAKLKLVKTKCRKTKRCLSVLTYIRKDLCKQPVQHHDYVFIKDKRSCPIIN